MSNDLYRPLTQAEKVIRLVRIRPGRFDEPIECEMFEVSLGSLPDFEALSYVWGAPVFPHQIRINQRMVSITQNLMSALAHLRHEKIDRTMWIDALCINQKDTIERNHQVVHMGSIYSSALQVVVWLGEGSIINVNLVLGNEQYELIHPEDTSGSPLQMTINGIDETDVVLLSDITNLLEDPWWYRTWTLQEAVLAQRLTFMRGHRSLSETAIRHLQSRSWRESLTSGAYENWRLLQLARRQRSYGMFDEFFAASFLGVLATQRHRACEEPKDRLYGLLALATATDAELVKPDYSLTDGVVFADFAFAYIASRHDLELFSVISLLESSSAASWALDLHTSHRRILPEASTMDHRMVYLKHYTAAQDSHCSCFRRLAESTISLGGVIIDYIDDIHELQWSDNTPLSMRCVFNQLIELVGNVLQNRFGRRLSWVAEVFYYLLLGLTSRDTSQERELKNGKISQNDTDRQIPKEYGRHASSQTCLESTSRQNADLLVRLTDLVGQMDLDSDKRRYRACVYSAMFQRSLVLTKNGYVGLAHNQTQKGDVMVVPDGGRVPYILRQQEDIIVDGRGTSCWKLVGDSCFYGLMNGEAGQLGGSKETFILT